jgi:hypothetical protein
VPTPTALLPRVPALDISIYSGLLSEKTVVGLEQSAFSETANLYTFTFKLEALVAARPLDEIEPFNVKFVDELESLHPLTNKIELTNTTENKFFIISPSVDILTEMLKKFIVVPPLSLTRRTANLD